MQKRIIAVAVIVVMMTSCARSHRISESNGPEVDVGDAIHRQIVQSMPIYRDERVNEYVESIGSEIASHADREKLRYQFTILSDERIYATNAPSGYVYITTGFLEFLENESELAAVLAHEVGALQYKDPRLSRVKKSVEFLLLLGSYVGPIFGSVGGLGVLGLALFDGILGRKRPQQTRILDADRRAVTYLAKARFDPQALADVLYRIDDLSVPDRPYLYDYVESHPLWPDRFEKLGQELQSIDESADVKTKWRDPRKDIYFVLTNPLRTYRS